MPDLFDAQTILTQGLTADVFGDDAPVRSGFPVELTAAVGASPDVRKVVPVGTDVQAGAGTVVAVQDAATVYDVKGAIVLPTTFNTVDLGSGHTLQFDQDTFNGRITPSLATSVDGALSELMDDGAHTYTGSNCRVMIEIADPLSGLPRSAKQLLELTTITVSTHRVKSAVPAAGFINTKGFSRGRRTIAGTLVLTKFTVEVLFRFLASGVIRDKSKDLHYMKVDQLPPFNISLLFSNEYGHASYQRLLGVEFVTDGNIYSIQDMLTEQTISYVAADFTPLLPLTFPTFYQSADRDRTTAPEKTPGSLWKSRNRTIFA